MTTLSIKELRANLPKVLKKLSKGQGFVLIYRSKPVGELLPLRKAKSGKKTKGLYGLLKEPFGEITLPTGQTSTDLIREDRR